MRLLMLAETYRLNGGSIKLLGGINWGSSKTFSVASGKSEGTEGYSCGGFEALKGLHKA